MHERDSMHTQTEMGRQPLAGQSLLAQRHNTAAKVSLAHPLSRGRGSQSQPLGASVQEAYKPLKFPSMPCTVPSTQSTHIPH